MTGGLAAAFKLDAAKFDDENYDKDFIAPCNDMSETIVVDDDGDLGGGIYLKLAWIFNGESWEKIAPMTVVRDHPACSLVEMDDGEVLFSFTYL